MTDWRIFTGQEPADGEDPRERLKNIDTPPWRNFQRKNQQPFVSDAQTIRMVNAAIHLRRPLLVTGNPGTGKSSLARAITRQLGLDPMLKWPITTRSTLQEGLYHYDAIARLHDIQSTESQHPVDTLHNVARYIRLGPLGTALTTQDYPRVLLIDEIDKGDVDLPNDLLHVFEDGDFSIRELKRWIPEEVTEESERTATVQTDDNQTTTIIDGYVQCKHFPIIILTSNGERDFPPAFLRRCIQLEMAQPPEDELITIVQSHLGADLYAEAQMLIDGYVREYCAQSEATKGGLATDQLLNLVFLMTRAVKLDEQSRKELEKKLFKPLKS